MKETQENDYANENGIWRKLSDEEYEREKVEIEVCLEVLIELLQKVLEQGPAATEEAASLADR